MAKRVLVVDDDQYIRELYEEVLKAEGYEVETAFDGEEGYNKLLEGGYDLALLDMMMPKLDGMGVLSKLFENPPVTKNGPIILLTNLGHDPILNDALKKGAASFLIKADMTPDQLIANVKKFLPN